MHFDTVIIGQGLAGTCLALQLEKRGENYVIIDNALEHSSSLVAAGLYNPVVFRKPSLSFNAPKLIPYLKQFYAYWEDQWQTSFHQERNIIKVFSSYEELNNWSVKCTQADLSPFLKAKTLDEGFDKNLNCPFGGGMARQSGNVYLDQFLSSFRSNFSSKLIHGKVLSISSKSSGLQIQTTEGELTCSRVISAIGHKKQTEFEHLPLGDTKGDVLTIYCPEIEGVDIINKGFFIMPLGDGFHRVGATFEWDNKSYAPSQKAREELSHKLDGLLQCNYKIEDQRSGLRPTVGDRRPLIGEHPEIKNLFIFNGLGSKGVMLAPYYSEQLVNHIFDDASLDPEVNITRYKKHYGNSKN